MEQETTKKKKTVKVLKYIGLGLIGSLTFLHALGVAIVLTIILVLVLILFLYPLGEVDTTQLAKEEFSQYYDGQNKVAIVSDDRDVYFEDFFLDEDEFEFGYARYCTAAYKNAIYFVGPYGGPYGDHMNFYSCDYSGKHTKLIHSEPIEGKIDYYGARFVQGSYYIKYQNERDEMVYIDKYTISTGIYENIASGNKLDLDDYLPTEEYIVELVPPSSECENGMFIITDPNSGEQKTVDDTFLKDTPYLASMEKYGYWVESYTISEGHILLEYGSSAGRSWNIYNPNYAYLVFEYDFNTETLEYRLLIFHTAEESRLETYYLE